MYQKQVFRIQIDPESLRQADQARQKLAPQKSKKMKKFHA
jgi:hypothetical protein